MPLEIKAATVQPNTQTTFTFSDTIAQRMVGISGFSLTYGSDDHHVETMSIALSVNQSGKQLQITPVASLFDKNGHNMDQSKSTVTIVAMAWVGVNDDNLHLGNASNISNNGESSPIAIPCTNPAILQAALAGFGLSYGSTDHHVETVLAAVGTAHSGSSAFISGQAQMYDQSGNTASTATVNGGLLANCDTSLTNLQIQLTSTLQDSTQDLTFDSGASAYFPFLTNFKTQFNKNKDHHLKTITVDLSIQKTAGTVVTVKGGAYLSDDSGNSQDNGVSHVVGFVVGY